MSKWVAKIMLSICLWNVVGGSLPAAAAEFVANTVHQATQASNCYVITSDTDHGSSCDPFHCEDETCRFHQCHFGHCQIVPVSYSASLLKPDATLSHEAYVVSCLSTELSGRDRPPRA
jgi:hypothetical protein